MVYPGGSAQREIRCRFFNIEQRKWYDEATRHGLGSAPFSNVFLKCIPYKHNGFSARRKFSEDWSVVLFPVLMGGRVFCAIWHASDWANIDIHLYNFQKVLILAGFESVSIFAHIGYVGECGRSESRARVEKLTAFTCERIKERGPMNDRPHVAIFS